MKDKLNNLISIDDFSNKMMKSAKATKRTDVAKDILESKKNECCEKPTKEKEYVVNKLHNICCLDEFTEKEFLKGSKETKRTSVGKDILGEGKSYKHTKDDDDDDTDKGKKFKKGFDAKTTKKEKIEKDCKGKECKGKDCDCEDDEPKKGLSAAQKKLPVGLQNAILKKQAK